MLALVDGRVDWAVLLAFKMSVIVVKWCSLRRAGLPRERKAVML